jgi:hypothetical protein
MTGFEALGKIMRKRKMKTTIPSVILLLAAGTAAIGQYTNKSDVLATNSRVYSIQVVP